MASAFNGDDYDIYQYDEDAALKRALERSRISQQEEQQWEEVKEHVLDESAKDDSDELRFVVIGETGSGKSETSNSILYSRNLFKTSMSASSVTKTCIVQKGQVQDRTISIVDTPGLFDADMDTEDLLREITRCTMMTAPGPHALLLVIRIGRMSQQVQETVRIFREVFGDKCADYMIVVFTGKKSLSEVRSGGCNVEDYVGTVQKDVADVLRDCNNRYVVFENKVETDSEENKEQVEELLLVVDDMVRSNGSRHYTNDMFQEAGRRMKEKESELRQKYEAEKQEEMQALRAMYEEELREIEGDANKVLYQLMKESRDNDMKEIEDRYGKKDVRHEVRKAAETGSLWESCLRALPILLKAVVHGAELFTSCQRGTVGRDMPRHMGNLTHLINDIKETNKKK